MRWPRHLLLISLRYLSSKTLSNHGVLRMIRELRRSFILRVSFTKLVGRICADQAEHLADATFRFAAHRTYATISASSTKCCKAVNL